MDKSKHILIIEDDPSMSKFLRRRLQSVGFNVLLARDGKEGLEEAKRDRPDLIILDLGLPVLTGEEVCKAIREDKDKTFSVIPIIMLTGKTGDVDRVIGKVIGANSYVTKPFDTEALLDEVRRFT